MIRRKAIGAIGACAALMVSAWVSGAAPGSPGKPSDEPAGQASCDVDGVATGFATGYEPAPPPPDYEVTAVRVSGLAPTCAGADLSVQVALAAGGSVAGGPVAVSGATADVPLATSTRAADVAGVRVELAGGELPVPPECAGMSFSRVFSGTTGDDDQAGSNGGDLVFALAGADRATGGNGADCLDGGAGADDLRGDNQDDVLVGGAGADRLDGGTLDDAAYGGEGDDVLTGGVGNDLLDGGPGHDTCVGGPGANRFVSCEVQR